MTALKHHKIASALNRLNDGFGKTLLGTVQNKPILLDLLNAIFSDKNSAAVHDRIKDVTLLDKELSPMHDGDKSCRVDLLCQTDAGSRINVELQTYIDRDLGIRVLVYTAKIIAQLLDQKIPYSKIRPTVIIVITDKDVRRLLKAAADSGTDERWHHIFGLFDSEDLTLRLTDKFEVHFIEVEKYPKIKLENMNRLGQWSAFFRHSNDGEFADLLDPIFNKVLKFEEEFMNNQDFMQIYRDREEMDRISAYANGMEDGLEKGLEKGMREGLKQGLEEGKNASQREFAISLLRDDMPLSFISKHTGLSIESLRAMKDGRP